ncbi:MAG: hypothetical protein ACXVX8_17545 [Blastococcus sp.]
MATQYWPERLEVVPELPRTASGKIQKSSSATGWRPSRADKQEGTAAFLEKRPPHFTGG